MSLILVLLVASSVIAAAPSPSAATKPVASATQPRPNGFVPSVPLWERYERMVRRNMFVRSQDRGVHGDDGRQATTQPATAPAATQPASSATWVLTGTVVTEQGRSALLEHAQTGEVRRLKVGEAVGGERVTRIESAGVELEEAGGLRWLLVGMSHDGQAAPNTMPSSGRVLKSDTTTGVDGAVSPAEAALIERMRARRQQEMNR